MKSYCLICKTNTNDERKSIIIQTKNIRQMQKSKCSVCKKYKFQFVKQK